MHLGTTWSGTINGRPLSNIEMGGSTRIVEFDTPGVYQSENIVRHFRGKLDQNDAMVGVLLQDQANKWADCAFAFGS